MTHLLYLPVIAVTLLSLGAAAQEPDEESAEVSLDQAIRSVESVAKLEPMLVQLDQVLRASDADASPGWLIELIDDLNVHRSIRGGVLNAALSSGNTKLLDDIVRVANGWIERSCGRDGVKSELASESDVFMLMMTAQAILHADVDIDSADQENLFWFFVDLSISQCIGVPLISEVGYMIPKLQVSDEDRSAAAYQIIQSRPKTYSVEQTAKMLAEPEIELLRQELAGAHLIDGRPPFTVLNALSELGDLQSLPHILRLEAEAESPRIKAQISWYRRMIEFQHDHEAGLEYIRSAPPNESSMRIWTIERLDDLGVAHDRIEAAVVDFIEAAPSSPWIREQGWSPRQASLFLTGYLGPVREACNRRGILTDRPDVWPIEALRWQPNHSKFTP